MRFFRAGMVENLPAGEGGAKVFDRSRPIVSLRRYGLSVDLGPTEMNCESADVGCLTKASSYATIVCMRTTLNIDENILKRAFELTGIQEKTALVRLGLEALVARQSGKRLAALGGSESQLRPIRRRR